MKISFYNKPLVFFMGVSSLILLNYNLFFIDRIKNKLDNFNKPNEENLIGLIKENTNFSNSNCDKKISNITINNKNIVITNLNSKNWLNFLQKNFVKTIYKCDKYKSQINALICDIENTNLLYNETKNIMQELCSQFPSLYLNYSEKIVYYFNYLKYLNNKSKKDNLKLSYKLYDNLTTNKNINFSTYKYERIVKTLPLNSVTNQLYFSLNEINKFKYKFIGIYNNINGVKNKTFNLVKLQLLFKKYIDVDKNTKLSLIEKEKIFEQLLHNDFSDASFLSNFKIQIFYLLQEFVYKNSLFLYTTVNLIELDDVMKNNTITKNEKYKKTLNLLENKLFNFEINMKQHFIFRKYLEHKLYSKIDVNYFKILENNFTYIIDLKILNLKLNKANRNIPISIIYLIFVLMNIATISLFTEIILYVLIDYKYFPSIKRYLFCLYIVTPIVFMFMFLKYNLLMYLLFTALFSMFNETILFLNRDTCLKYLTIFKFGQFFNFVLMFLSFLMIEAYNREANILLVVSFLSMVLNIIIVLLLCLKYFFKKTNEENNTNETIENNSYELAYEIYMFYSEKKAQLDDLILSDWFLILASFLNYFTSTLIFIFTILTFNSNIIYLNNKLFYKNETLTQLSRFNLNNNLTLINVFFTNDTEYYVYEMNEKYKTKWIIYCIIFPFLIFNMLGHLNFFLYIKSILKNSKTKLKILYALLIVKILLYYFMIYYIVEKTQTSIIVIVVGYLTGKISKISLEHVVKRKIHNTIKLLYNFGIISGIIASFFVVNIFYNKVIYYV